MPDDRLFHKTLGHSEKVNSLTDFEDLAWRSYVLAADDFGIMRFSAITLRAENDRMARKSQKIVQRALEAVAATGLIRTFEHQNRIYCYQHDWQDWQKVTYPKRTVNPMLPPDVLMSCTDNTRWLFTVFPGAKKITSWMCPDSFKRPSGIPPESLPTPESLTRVRALTNGYKANGNDERQEANGSAERAGSFVEWYQDKHSQLFGVGYIGNPQKDYQVALQLVDALSDQEVRDAALVWFGQDDDFARNGTRSIPKFASRASACLQLAKGVA